MLTLGALALLFSTVMQNPNTPTPGGAASFQLEDLSRTLEKSGHAWLPFLDVPTLTTGLYRLPKGVEDRQTPHDQDEVYYVAQGKAVLDVAGKRYPARAGSILFVAAEVPHRFVDIEEDLSVVVFFSTAIPVTGGMAAAAAPPTKQTPYPETAPRGSTRIFYWFGPGSAGQVSIDYGLPKWQPGYQAMLGAKQTQRWRFGQDFWTRLDTNIDLEIGGVELEKGDYYLALEMGAEQGPRLIALDPDSIRSKRLDAYQAPATTGGIVLPLRRENDGVHSDRLRIELTLDPDEADRGLLEIRFGPHRLTAEVEMHPAR